MHPLRYILFISLLIGACASFSATGRITVGLLLSLSVCWMFVPVLHVLIARVVAGRRGDVLLAAHAPWSLWLIAASIATGMAGYALYFWALLAALVPIALTVRIVYTFSRAELGDSPRRALIRTLAHQGATWLVAAIYLDRAVSLVPRVIGWVS